jgi:sulfonate transport system permease protein
MMKEMRIMPPAIPKTETLDILDPKEARDPYGEKSRPQWTAKIVDCFSALAVPVIVIIIWQTITVLNVFPPIILPPPEAVLRNFMNQIQSGLLFSDLFISMSRVIKGYLIGVSLGIVFGVLMGMSLRINGIFSGVFTGIRQIPGITWIPLLILWFGIGETSKLVLIAKGTFFPVLVNTIDGIRNISRGYLELAKLYKVKKIDLITRIYLPGAVPSIFVGLRLGAGMAWMSVVGAELLASSDGLGYRISNAQQLMQSNVLLVDMIVIGVVGALLDFLLRKSAGLVSRWNN